MIAFVLRKVDWSSLGELLTQLHPGWALAGWALTSLLIAGLAFRWQIFLRRQKIELPFSTIFSLTWAGQFFNSILPGSTGGDVVKIYQVCQLTPDRKAVAAATVFVDRLTALIALLALAAAAFVIEPAPLSFLPLPSLSYTAIGGGFAALLLLAIAGSWLLYRPLRASVWGGRLIRTLAAAKASLSINPSFLFAVLLSFTIHLLNFSIAYLFARALGISITYLQVLTMLPVVLCLILLPITINGHGLRELLLIGYFSQMNITVSGQAPASFREVAVAFSLVLVTNDLLWSIPGGIWYMARYRSSNQTSKKPTISVES